MNMNFMVVDCGRTLSLLTYDAKLVELRFSSVRKILRLKPKTAVLLFDYNQQKLIRFQNQLNPFIECYGLKL